MLCSSVGMYGPDMAFILAKKNHEPRFAWGPISLTVRYMLGWKNSCEVTIIWPVRMAYYNHHMYNCSKKSPSWPLLTLAERYGFHQNRFPPQISFSNHGFSGGYGIAFEGVLFEILFDGVLLEIFVSRWFHLWPFYPKCWRSATACERTICWFVIGWIKRVLSRFRQGFKHQPQGTMFQRIFRLSQKVVGSISSTNWQ